MNKNLKSKIQPAAVALVTLLSICVFQPSAQAVLVSGGDLTGMGGSTVGLAAVTPYPVYAAQYTSGQTDGIIHLRLDMLSIQNVTSLQFTNRVNTTTNYAPLRFTIYVADESAPGFNPNTLSLYNIIVFANNTASPSTTAANAVQSLDVTDFSKRYVLIDITATSVPGSIQFGGAPDRGLSQFSDVNYTVVPEPNTVALLGLAVLGMILPRRFRRVVK